MYGSYKKPGGSKSLRAFFKMSKRFHAYAETFFKKPETFFRKRRNIFLKARGLFRRAQKASAGWPANVRSLRPNRPHDEPQ